LDFQRNDLLALESLLIVRDLFPIER
jgi:hypothetical protein